MKQYTDYQNEMSYLKRQAVDRLFYLAKANKIKKVKIKADICSVFAEGQMRPLKYITVKQSKIIAVCYDNTAIDISEANILHKELSLELTIMPLIKLFESLN